MSALVRGAVGIGRAGGYFRRYATFRNYSRFGRIIRRGLRIGALADAVGHARKAFPGKKRQTDIRQFAAKRTKSNSSWGGGPSRPSHTAPPPGKMRAPRTSPGGASGYGGKFARVRRVSRPSPYVTKGFETTTEVTGTVTDTDCVYIGATCSKSRAAVEAVLYALLRRAFEKCVQYPVKNIKEQLVGFYNSVDPRHSVGDGWRFQLTMMNLDTGVQTEMVYDTVQTDSIYSIIGDELGGVAPAWTALIIKMIEWSSGQYLNTTNVEVPMMFNVYRKEGNVAIFWQGNGGIDMRQIRVHYKSMIDMKLQNRSLGENGGTESDNVTNNPLEGFKIEFNGAVPLVKDVSYGFYKLSRLPENEGGVILVTGATLGTPANGGSLQSSIGKEPIKPQMYSNCVGASKVRLNPGSVKNTTLSYSFSLSFMDALKRIAYETDGTSARIAGANKPGKSVMFSLEDTINVNAAQKIAVAYEVNRVTSCYITEKTNKVASGKFIQVTKNLLS